MTRQELSVTGALLSGMALAFPDGVWIARRGETAATAAAVRLRDDA